MIRIFMRLENMSLHDSVAIANEIRYALGMKRSGWWQMSLAIATVTLSDRGKRRRFITGLLVLIVAYFSLGNWPLDSWLSRGLWRMLIFWGFLGLMCLFMILMALFDALAVIGEERQKIGLTKSSKNEESLQD
jgi:fatty acid desaturase